MTPINGFDLPRVHATGVTKGHSARRVAITENDQFGSIIPGNYVLAVLRSEQYTIGSMAVRNDYKARIKNGILQNGPIPRSQYFWDNFSSLLEMNRGLGRGPVKYSAVEVPVLDEVEELVGKMYSGHLTINPHDEAEAAQWHEFIMSIAETLGMNVEDVRKLNVRDALVAASNVRDRRGQVNAERISLVVKLINRLLTERRGDITIKGWRMSRNLAAGTQLQKHLFDRVEIMKRVAFQAYRSDPLTGVPGNVIRQDNAVNFWRQHATELRQCPVRPFGNWFYAMSVVLDRAANALEEGNVDVVKDQMVLLQAVAMVAEARKAVERVLEPVAEMHAIGKLLRKGETDDGSPWRTFSLSWTQAEAQRLLGQWKTSFEERIIPLSKGDTPTLVFQQLVDGGGYLAANDIPGAYKAFKLAGSLLERPLKM